MSQRIAPARDRLMIRVDDPPVVECGEDVSTGEIIGSGCMVDGVVVHQKVAFLNGAAQDLTSGGETVTIIHADDVIAIV